MSQLGTAKITITPPFGTRLGGYRARTEGADRVHDDLHLRALAIETDGTRVALLSIDVMAVDAEWVEELRRYAEQALGVPAAHLFVAPTHTHAGTGGLFRFGGAVGQAFEAMMGGGAAPYDAVGYEQLLRQAKTALHLAFSDLAPVTFARGRGSAEGIAGNRVRPDVQADSSVVVVAARAADGATRAVLFHFGCHPTVLGEGDRGISADFPGVAASIVEGAYGPQCVALFLNGAVGDVSTRFTRNGHGYADSVRFGRILGGEVVKLTAAADPMGGDAVGAAVRTVDVAPRADRWVERVEQRFEQLEAAQDGSHGAARLLLTAREGVESATSAGPRIATLETVPVELQHLWIGDVSFVGVPAEVFAATAAQIAAGVPDRIVRVISPANGYLGYLPSAESYETGGYEVGCALVDRGAAEQLARESVDLVRTSVESSTQERP